MKFTTPSYLVVLITTIANKTPNSIQWLYILIVNVRHGNHPNILIQGKIVHN